MHGQNALTVDVEDYFQVEAFAGVIDRGDWDALPRRVVRNTDRLLDILADSGVSGTFFTLGWVAERHPELVRRIVADGHELASHGSDHYRVDQQSPAEFRNDIRRSKALLEDIGGAAVTGYRAPTFSVGAKSRWAHADTGRGGVPLQFERLSDRARSLRRAGGAAAPVLPASRIYRDPADDGAPVRPQFSDGGRGLFPPAALCRHPHRAAQGRRRASHILRLLPAPLGDRPGPAAPGSGAVSVPAAPLCQSRPHRRPVAPASARLSMDPNGSPLP